MNTIMNPPTFSSPTTRPDPQRPAQRAVFIDKDGTLVHDVPYNVDPEHIALRDDAGEALQRLSHAGYALVLVTNQAGIAKGFFPEQSLAAVWVTLDERLAPYGIAFDGIYHCPHHPQGTVAAYAIPCNCRKPHPGLLLRAAAEHGYDLGRSWMIGDILDDVEAAHRAGCRAVLLDVGSETEWLPGPYRRPDYVASSLNDAATHILQEPFDLALAYEDNTGNPTWTS